VAAGEYFLALYHYAYATGDDSGLRALSDANCAYCNSIFDDISTERNAGQHETGGEITVTKSSATQVDPEFYTANFTVAQGSSDVLDASGQRVDGGPGGPFLIDIAFYYKDGRWSAAAVQVKRA
jgi:hypothetical protein